MEVILNPGSEPVANASVENASVNMEVFAENVMAKHGYDHVYFSRRPSVDDDGRYGYALMCDAHVFDIEMPGLPLEQVRWMRLPGQNIWEFPRMYVDGNSWVWLHALNNTAPEDAEV